MMSERAPRFLLAASALAVVAAAACSQETAPLLDAGPGIDVGFADTDGGATLAMPDFRLIDASPRSARTGQLVSPRDYLGHVSGWYFTHAT